MKKIICLVLALVLCTALAVPAFAEDEPTEVVPVEGSILLMDSGSYIISSDCELIYLNVGTDVTLTVAKGVTVTVTETLFVYGTINILGTLITSAPMGQSFSSGTIRVYGCCGGTMEGRIFAGKGTVSTYKDHFFVDGKCTVCQEKCTNAFHDGVYKCPDCDMEFNTVSGDTASTLSEGNLAIITAVAGVAVGFLAAIFIFKKKKKTAVAEGENKDEE